jgi:hypothetical protein
LPKDKLDIRERYILTITAQEAKKFGLATEIADFCPPKGMQLFNISK